MKCRRLKCQRCAATMHERYFGFRKASKVRKTVCVYCCESLRNEALDKLAKSSKKSHCSGVTFGDGMSYESRNGSLTLLGFSSYRAYLDSQLWSSIRGKVYATKGHVCCICGQRSSLLHHTRYHMNDLRGESLEFIHPMCKECHEAVEFEGETKISMKQALDKFYRRQREFKIGRRSDVRKAVQARNA